MLLQSERNSAWSSIAGHIIVTLSVGAMNIWSVFQLPVCDFFGWDYGSVVLVTSFFMFAFVTGSFLHGLLSYRFHPRIISLLGAALFSGGLLLSSVLQRSADIWTLYAAYGILVGLGSGLVNNNSIFELVNWLPTRKGLAAGISGTCYYVSGILLSVYIQYLLPRHPLPRVFRTVGLVTFAVMAVGCLLICRPSKAYLSRFDRPQTALYGTPLPQAVRDIRFWLIALFILLSSALWNILVPIIKPLGLARGLSESMAGLTVSLGCIVGSIGKLGFGLLSDRIGRNAVLVITTLANIVGAVLLIFATGSLYSIGVWLPSIAFASAGCVIPLLACDNFGPRYAGAIYGLAFYGGAISSVLFNRIATAINADGAVTGNYTASFLMCIVINLAALAIIALLRYFQTKRAPS